MAWSYDSSLAADRDKVRLKIGDTDTKRQLLQNSEIDVYLDAGNSILQTAIKSVTDIIAKLARDYDRSSVGMNTVRSQAIAHYEILLDRLESEFALQAGPSWGGLSTSDKETLEADTDYPDMPFGRTRNDHT